MIAAVEGVEPGAAVPCCGVGTVVLVAAVVVAVAGGPGAGAAAVVGGTLVTDETVVAGRVDDGAAVVGAAAVELGAAVEVGELVAGIEPFPPWLAVGITTATTMVSPGRRCWRIAATSADVWTGRSSIERIR